MTLVWLVVWFVADHMGGRAPLVLQPANWWAITLLLAIALDLSASHAGSRRKR